MSPTYEEARQPHLQAMLSRVAAESEKLAWPLERLHRLRDERLRELIRHAKLNSPWHAKRLKHIDPDTVSGGDLDAIPPMTKADVMENWDEIVTDPRLNLEVAQAHLDKVSAEGPAYLFDEYHVVTTGGSSGLTGLFPWDWQGWLEVGVAAWRMHPWLARDLALPLPGRGAFVGAGHASHASDAIRATFDPPKDSCKVPVTMPLAEIVTRLNEFDADQILAYPSILHRLAYEKQAGRLTIAPRIMLVGAEPLHPHMRETIEAAFGAPVIDFYGTSETWMLACSYPGDEALHLVEDTVVYEPVDAHGAPVPPGELSAKLLVTNVVNKVFPLIRYEIADEVRFLDTPNPGPWTGRRIAPVRGRHDDLFEYAGDVLVHPYVFWTPLWDSHIAQYQVRQTPAGADVIVELRSEYDLDHVRDALVAALREVGMADPVVTVRAVDVIERSRVSGKIRTFIPLPKPRAV
ncbi:phenylacetate--CoA ligase family protein [Micromonospora mirobrigensis]|uniref:Phenylacetate-coenzyme A ligase PaaK, adenylate-forming domain family n=1 Tax=Micromonospora mirobrigensis TaxID=262898 RepID=A0A1C4Z3J2_9ACTN|nr:phenylacetate--CoA ligase family protein [Micromonospora mirobrigensis]SCF27592.1 Phenylacetate-coenzyme A ligase PaaK, adenylate-forming domain family [Micromonospora mirobrigensis]